MSSKGRIRSDRLDSRTRHVHRSKRAAEDGEGIKAAAVVEGCRRPLGCCSPTASSRPCPSGAQIERTYWRIQQTNALQERLWLRVPTSKTHLTGGASFLGVRSSAAGRPRHGEGESVNDFHSQAPSLITRHPDIDDSR